MICQTKLRDYTVGEYTTFAYKCTGQLPEEQASVALAPQRPFIFTFPLCEREITFSSEFPLPLKNTTTIQVLLHWPLMPKAPKPLTLKEDEFSNL